MTWFRYWIYWVPAQFVEGIKDVVLGKWSYHWGILHLSLVYTNQRVVLSISVRFLNPDAISTTKLSRIESSLCKIWIQSQISKAMKLWLVRKEKCNSAHYKDTSHLTVQYLASRKELPERNFIKHFSNLTCPIFFS